MAIEGFLRELDGFKAEVAKAATAHVQDYFRTKPGLESLLSWLEVFDDREIGVAKVVSASLVKDRGEFTRPTLVSMGKMIWEETMHHRMLGQAIERLRKPGLPEPASPVVQRDCETAWWDVLWRSMEQDNVSPFAGFCISEGSELAAFPSLVQGFRHWGLTGVADAYARMEAEEVSHLNLHRAILEEYALTERQRDLALETGRKVANYQLTAWKELFEK